jgi:hypothetical protein
MKESASASHIRLFAAQCGVDLWRNNVGACEDHTGRQIRYGLCNDSPTLAKRVKSSDFIGITPVLITPQMIGQVIGVFTAVETKASDWKFSPSDERALAQSAFHDIVRRAGGFAGFARHIEDFKRIVGK